MAKMITGISVYQSDGGWSQIYPLVGSQGEQVQIPAASDTVAGIMRVYSTTGNNTDGTMTQNAISSAIQTAINSIPGVGTASPTTAGISRLYDGLGGATDGAVTQRAVQAAINSIPAVSQATSTNIGVAKLYTGSGSNTDGSMTQRAITDAINAVDNGSFDTVAVGQTRFAASQDNGTVLNLAAGDNVTLTANARTNTVTIASNDTTYTAATTSTSGLMSSTDKSNLNDLITQVTQLPVGNGSVRVETSDWSGATTTVNGTAYYTATKTLSILSDTNPVIYLGPTGSNILPTEDEETAYSDIKYVTVDVNAKTVRFYAEKVPASAITVIVKNCTRAS